MQEWEWGQALEKFPGGHLVSGYYERDGLSRLVQIRQLISSMGPRGQYACRSAIEKGEAKIDAVFELQVDGEALGRLVKAKRGSVVSGYATYRWFEYTPLIFRVIARSQFG